ncbi:hypothetical protein [Paenibacillus sp.]|uniref:hypothetical protein n=1 Tax=Paenibacillus sp. TaxID=58172 RepID=UPI002D2E2A09|nr:hypothetical protein [Paenibacillus sp.]HZG86682.1 hypothetical protein [Paenibacillus sp.]
MKYIFKDHWNPTKEEIYNWALDEDALCDQDWELAVAQFEHFELMVQLANDNSLAKRYFFLGCLYVFTGDIVRSENQSEIERLKSLINQLNLKNESNEIKDWRLRSLYLIQNPSQYDYTYWGLNSKYI